MMTAKRIFLKILTYSILTLIPLAAQASFIETTQGTAVINDATASYYNPAALVQMKNPQIIPQGTVAKFRTHFSGQATPLSTGIPELGSSSTNTQYYSPSLFLGLPASPRVTLGLAIVSNSANRNAEENSVLRYLQSSNNIQDLDVVPAIAFKINDYLSLGAGINFSYGYFNLAPIVGIPGSNIPDSQSQNKIDGTGIGGNAGFLITPGPATVIGFNYRSLTSYHLSGTSTYEGSPPLSSNNYHFIFWSPARSVFSINHFLTKKLGFITTIQRMQWSAMSNVHVYGIATLVGSTPAIVNGVIPYYLRDTWAFTLGSHYRPIPKWVTRVALSYNQSPSNPSYQISNGDSIILGASMGYDLNKKMTIDGSYAHAFIKNQNIDISGKTFLVNGVNQGSRDSISLKLTFNV